ncbi:MAG: hypothetical protein A2077_01620 [Nitrospirae bacterium GWC2_46_6]|nr:MAG: hypothetical protein A2077_01620 [Nitrospirae bacterium GWC2_46_6]OGW19875.1 MAG: hypothetical protein A2Z82_04000 [Nitrospirae bacterium GWA2_46_11]OGW23315.1 MAG: hypothetical protein A2X55_11000 [Nitrospirae bacterium GWB2_47_37]HAK88819.1 hypothetical protein [Nitrospiraceae bacterium]HCL81215.1 hypothetical protein [Nitrospiraceae bacterium]
MSYELKIENKRLIFNTTSFKAEKGSVLHSGIYNREMSASLAAGAVVMLSGFFFAAKYKITVVHFIAALFLFVILFLVFRAYIFGEPLLGVVIDKGKGNIDISLDRILGKKNLSFPLASLEDIRQDHKSIAAENPDGIRFVEKIALQHGTVIPGFGKTSEFYTVEMEFENSRRVMIFSSEDPAAADDIALKIKNFIER